MGYNVYYSGDIEITPALTKKDRTFFQSMIGSDPGRKTTRKAVAILETIEEEYSPCFSFPMSLSEDGAKLEALDEEEREGLSVWLAGFIKYFFQPRGYSLEGSATYSGECSSDHGEIFVKGDAVEIVEDVEANEGPSWAPKPFVSHLVAKLIQSVVDSADSTGCDGDLTVCSKSAVEALAAVVRSKTTGAAMPALAVISETNLQPSELSEKYDEPGKWGQHPMHTMALWQMEVSRSETRRGYWDWVACKLEEESAEESHSACSTAVLHVPEN